MSGGVGSGWSMRFVREERMTGGLALVDRGGEGFLCLGFAAGADAGSNDRPLARAIAFGLE